MPESADPFKKMMIEAAARDPHMVRSLELAGQDAAPRLEKDPDFDVTALFARLVEPILGQYCLGGRTDADWVYVELFAKKIEDTQARDIE